MIVRPHFYWQLGLGIELNSWGGLTSGITLNLPLTFIIIAWRNPVPTRLAVTAVILVLASLLGIVCGLLG